ncbi:MAG: glycoside hydrolase family 88 protein [Actinomycetota bacterium]|nr:glycoside hydrolase family 88 protein [Actinomycetota bacterium]
MTTETPTWRQAPDSTALPDAEQATALLRKVATSLTKLAYRPWFFGDSVAFEAMIASSTVLGDLSFAAFARGFARAWAVRRHPFTREDCTAPGLAIVDLAGQFADGLLLEAAIELADYLAQRPKIYGIFETFEHSPLQHPYGPDTLAPADLVLLADPPPGVFVDCLHFDPPFFTALGAALGEDRYLSLGVEQALAYIELLQGEDGLFRHFALRDVPRLFGAGWGRGQGWALCGLLDVLERLPAGDGRADTIRGSASRLIAAMVECQRPDGHWDAVVHEPMSGVETSTAAFMAWAFARAQRLGVAGDEVSSPRERAICAAVASTTPDGVLRGVSAAVNACTRQSHYAHVPRDFLAPWGQGPLALALSEQLIAVRS